MTVEITAKVAAAQSLAAINTIVAQNEENVGPLTGIGHDKGFTTLTFVLADEPATKAVIRSDRAGVPDVPTGAATIDTDMIFIAGVPTLCTASRAKP